MSTHESILSRLETLAESEVLAPEDFEWLRPQLAHADADVRAGAAAVLAGHEEEGALAEAILPLLADSAATVREAAARALGVVVNRLGDEGVLRKGYDPAAPEAAHDIPGELAVRVRAALLECLSDASDDVQGAALVALAFLGSDSEVESHVASFAADQTSAVRRAAAIDAMMATGLLGRWDEAVGAALDDADARVREAAAVAVGELEMEAMVDTLSAMALSAAENEVRVAAAYGRLLLASLTDAVGDVAAELTQAGVAADVVAEATEMIAFRELMCEAYEGDEPEA